MTFFQNQLFKKYFRNTIRVLKGLDPDHDRQTADILLIMIWVQTVRKGYQQGKTVAASKERIDTLKVNI